MEKYLILNDSHIIAGQNNQGVWYCKELPAKDIRELDSLIGEVNRVLNKYNKPKETGVVLKTDVGGVREMKQL